MSSLSKFLQPVCYLYLESFYQDLLGNTPTFNYESHSFQTIESVFYEIITEEIRSQIDIQSFKTLIWDLHFKKLPNPEMYISLYAEKLAIIIAEKYLSNQSQDNTMCSCGCGMFRKSNQKEPPDFAPIMSALIEINILLKKLYLHEKPYAKELSSFLKNNSL